MAENYQSIYEGEQMDELWTLAGTAVQKAKVNGQFFTPVAGVLTLPDYPSGAIWGNITGTLADQTDLQEALDAKYEQPTGGIPATHLASAVQATLSHADSLWNWFGLDADGNIYVKNGRNFYTEGEITAGGIGSGGSGGGGLASLWAKTSGSDVALYDDEGVAKFGISVNGSLVTPTNGVFSINTTGGSVTSVGLSVPTGFSASGSPVTSSGTLALGFAEGYSLPTTAKQTAWDETAQTVADLKAWIESMFEKDTTSIVGTTLIKAKFSLYTEGELTAGGVGSGSGGGGLIEEVYGYSDLGGTYSDSDKTNTFNAYTTARLAARITALEGSATAVSYTPAVTSGTALGTITIDNVGHTIYAPTGVTSLGGQSGAITVRGGQTAPGSVNLAMSGTQLQASIVGLATVATSGAYGDLSGRPTALSQFTNDSGFITASALSGYLPLSGGTMTGDLHLKHIGWGDSWNLDISGWAINPLLSSSTIISGAPVNYCCGYSFTTVYTGFQIASDFSSSNRFWIRGSYDQGNYWKDWQELIHSGNISSQSVLAAAIAEISDKVVGRYTLNGGQQNPDYFGVNSVGFLMMATPVNGNYQYKDWMIMDCYAGSDVGGAVALGINRQALGAYIMRSEAARTSWSQSAELYGTHNANNTSTPWTCSNLTANGNAAISGNVGIGTTSPEYKLDVVGTAIVGQERYGQGVGPSAELRFRGAGGRSLLCQYSVDNYGKISSFTISHDDWSVLTNYITLLASGNVGIGTTSPSEKFHIVGNILASGEITAGSDSRWKDNQTTVTNGIDIIKRLNPCTWTWNEQFADKNYIGRRSAGLIAQQVASVLPFAVRGNEENGFTLDYNVFHAYEIAALQSHETRIEALERENAELKRQIQQLKS